jgi:GNAT superfamily N-acetyltransferase
VTLEIKPVETKSDLRTFVMLPHSIFKGCPQWVPPLIRDELATLDPAKNPAFEDAEAKLFLAVQKGKPVGRIAGIISHAANKKYHTKNARFGWFDFVQDDHVAEALFPAVGEWARGRGMDTLTGPHGFTNFDRQGMLVEGFECLGNAYTIYNYPYYVRLLNFKTKAEVAQRGMELFRLLNQTYVDIYGVIPLSDHYIQYVIKKFISYVNMDLVSCAVDSHGRMVGFLITMPSLAKAFQKADGRLFPFGWYHLLRGLKSRECLDVLLVAVEEEYRRKGVVVLMLTSMVQKALSMGFRRSETGPMLEDNGLVQSLYKYFPSRTLRRRRVYKMRF